LFETQSSPVCEGQMKSCANHWPKLESRFPVVHLSWTDG